MQRSDPDDARRLADAAHPLLGAEGFNDELANAFVTDKVGEGEAQRYEGA